MIERDDFKLIHRTLSGDEAAFVEGDDVTTWSLPDGAIARLERGGVHDLAFSPDGYHLAVTTKIGIWWYEITTMSPIALWDTQRGMIDDIVFSPNGKWIATSNSDMVLKVWDVQQGKCTTRIEAVDYWDSFTFSSDNLWLATINRSTPNIEIRSHETGEIVTELVSQFEDGSRLGSIAFSPDNQIIASIKCSDSGNNMQSIIVWDVQSSEQITCLSNHNNSIYSICFSPCGKFLTSGGEGSGTVCVWNIKNWQQVEVYTCYGNSHMIPSYTPEGILHAAAVSDKDYTVTVWELENKEKLYTANSEGTMTFENGSQLAYQYGHEYLEVWTMNNPQPRRTVHTHVSFVNTSESMTFSPDGKTIAVEYACGDALFWNVESKRSRPVINLKSRNKKQHLYVSPHDEYHITTIDSNVVTLWNVGNSVVTVGTVTGHADEWSRPAVAPLANLLACADKDATISVWDIQCGKQLCKFKLHHGKHNPDDIPDDLSFSLEFSPDARFLTIAEHYYYYSMLWDVENNTEIIAFPSDIISDIFGYSPCGQYLACSISKKGTLLWDIEKQKICLELQNIFPLPTTFSPCGRYLACSGDEMFFYDLRQHEIHVRLSLPQECERMYATAFSACGNYFAAGAWWKQGMEKMPICLWEVETGKRIVTFWGHATDVQALAFSPDNKLLASASYDGSILLWDLTPYL